MTNSVGWNFFLY